MKSSRKTVGFAMVLSLFLVLVLYTGMTIMVANLRTDLASSKAAVLSAQSKFASQGAVNKLYSLLKNGASPEDYPKAQPLLVDIGKFSEVKAWVVKDEQDGVFHLVSELNGASFSRVVTNVESGGAKTYVNNGGRIFSLAENATAWASLPDPPQRAYDLMGNQIDSFDLQANSRYFNANNSGQVATLFYGSGDVQALYLWDERSRSWSDVPPAPGWRAVGGDIERGGPPEVRNQVTLMEESLVTFDNISITGGAPRSVVSIYDIQSKTWTDLKGPLDGARIVDGFRGPNDSFVAEVDNGSGPRAMKLVNGAWQELPLLPSGLLKVRGSGPEGEIYATDRAGGLNQLVDGQWTRIDVPQTDSGALLGELHSVDSSGTLIFWNRDGERLHSWNPSEEPKELPDVEDFQGVSGGGQIGDTVSEGFKTTATF